MFGLLQQRVTIKHPLYGETDRYGNDDPDFSQESSWVYVLAHVAPLTASEDQADKQLTVSEYRFIFDQSVELAADDRLEWDDLEFEVIGKPQKFYTPRGAHHIEVIGRLVEG